MKKLPVVLAITMTVTACDSPLGTSDADLLVVEAFLFAGEPVQDIRLTSTVPLGGDPAMAPVVNDAEVHLFRDGVTYTLTSVGDSGRYYYADDDLQVVEGDVFRLEVEHLGRVAWGETVVPGPPLSVEIDGDSLVAPAIQVGTGGRRQGGFDPAESQLIASWENVDELLHFVAVEGLDENSEAIFPEQLLERLGRFRFVSEPTLDDFYVVRLLQLRDLGEHAARVYRVNEEYSQLYENRTQDSRDLNEPPSNINNGLGVFSAFNSVVVFFDVVRGEPTS